MNWANLITFLRLLLIPVVIICYYASFSSANLWAAILFTIASMSDWLDGYLARKLGLTSAFGAFLDPVADKLLVAMVLIMLVTAYPVLLLATGIIISREILISALREWMASKGRRDAVAVAFSGKLKTTVQMFAIIALLFYSAESPQWIWQLGLWGIHLAALLSVYSMVHYFRNAWSALQES
ncbi:MAG: CDP-diacylglycerol--glycerol-3-phosphate 3-phosphatidyltransferase [Gammaproteobacteria bacterium]|nr:CDP-diacylglycerol--glycerol-3-phosphate 3-phosphatidyltransferase [Gammaproteobacteria bacterium]MDD9957778.1 CDP-diacylglycerol--glycerol-3-phosphate 3-phosphatidyltransferase [Gammaproteobacteria bacterium]